MSSSCPVQDKQSSVMINCRHTTITRRRCDCARRRPMS